MKVDLITNMGVRIKASKRDARILTMIGKATLVEAKPDPIPAIFKAPEPEVAEPSIPVKRVYRRRNMAAETAQTYHTRAIKDEPQE